MIPLKAHSSKSMFVISTEYNEGHFTRSKELMLKVEAKYDELCTAKK
jgi:hypothetical protein